MDFEEEYNCQRAEEKLVRSRTPNGIIYIFKGKA